LATIFPAALVGRMFDVSCPVIRQAFDGFSAWGIACSGDLFYSHWSDPDIHTSQRQGGERNQTARVIGSYLYYANKTKQIRGG
jgi:hypothetical protein